MTALALISQEPVRGLWPVAGRPSVVNLNGRRFLRSSGITKHTGTVAHYREDVPRNSAHLYLLSDGTYLINHLDEVNPRDDTIAHFIKDVLR